jgi:hypothetical protein
MRTKDNRTNNIIYQLQYQQHYGHVQNPKHFLSSPRMDEGTDEGRDGGMDGKDDG